MHTKTTWAFSSVSGPPRPPVLPTPGTVLDWPNRELPDVMPLNRIAASQAITPPLGSLQTPCGPSFFAEGTMPNGWNLMSSRSPPTRDGGDAAGEAKMLNRLDLVVMDLGHHERVLILFARDPQVDPSLAELGIFAAPMRA